MFLFINACGPAYGAVPLEYNGDIVEYTDDELYMINFEEISQVPLNNLYVDNTEDKEEYIKILYY
ncbi:MAG TPA: hypothetical protein VMX17_00390 [Candidatus Glassbacteria bacterium]|nr:hypothetical protein [Candidatus Glassbacteria bacterium]